MRRDPPTPRRWLATARLAAFLLLVPSWPALTAQEDAPTGVAEAAARPTRVLEVGTIHPVSGPPIRNGVIVIENGRITAIGAAGEVELPAGAQTTSYPDAHAYPGLVDALSTAFGDAMVLEDSAADAGTEILPGLDPHQETSRRLVECGITTAYVSNRGATTWRGMGAVLHPRRDGFTVAEHDAAAAAAVQMRISGGADGTHPLARQKALRDLGKPFAEVEDYVKKKAEHEKALEEYARKYEEYLEHFRKKKGVENDEGDAAEQSGDGAARAGRDDARPRGRRGGPGRGDRGERRRTPPAGGSEGGEEKKPEGAEPAQGKGEQAPSAAKTEEKKAEDKPPEKPKYPKPPTPSPAKESLHKVLDGALPLRVEARRGDEIEAALRMRREHEIPRVVLEVASGAGVLAEEIAAAGIPVVAAGFVDAERPADATEHTGDLPARLAGAGVEVAIGSGSVRSARFLPLLAAYGCGHGLDPDVAVAAITLTPAKILGVSRDVGSLEVGKRADVIVTSAPLLRSDVRILAVLSAGTTEYEAQ